MGKDQDIRLINVQCDVEKLRGDVRYLIYNHYDKGEGYAETLDPAPERLTREEVPEEFVSAQLVETWNDVFVYSPTVIMRLENSDTILPKTLPFMILMHVIINQIPALLIILTVKAVRRIVITTEKMAFGKEFPVREDLLELPEAKKNAARG